MFSAINNKFFSTLTIKPIYRTFSHSHPIFSGDLNNVTLLGTVASTGVTVEKSQTGDYVGVFNLLTRARYRSANRYMMKLVYHRIHVFDGPLIERVKNIVQGDRVCVVGCLTSFKKSSNDWMQCITAQNVILHSESGKPVESTKCDQEDEKEEDK